MQKSSPDQVIAEARTWVGTPYVHQHELKGVAVDCVGLILGVGKALDIVDWTEERWAPYRAYGRTPNPARMRRGMHEFLVPVASTEDSLCPAAEAKPGMIVWLQWRNSLPMHLAIVGTIEDRLTIIHAYNGAAKCVEHGFVDPWPGRVESVWKYPGLEL